MILIYISKKIQMIKPIENKTLDNNKDVWVKIETIYPENIQTPDYDYWLSQQTIDWPIWIRNLSSWWKAKTLIFTRLASVWTWNQSFTGFWFTPTNYTIQAWENSSSSTYAVYTAWWYDWTTEQCVFFDTGSSWTATYSMRLKTATLRTSANFVSFDADWITLNFNYSEINWYIMITCFW